jgi:catechol-2,3-dioxygenase
MVKRRKCDDFFSSHGNHRRKQMNTEIIVHPKLQHYGLVTANMDAMVDWYRNVLGMTINHRSAVSTGARNGAPFSAFAFVGNDEVHHRVVFFEAVGVAPDPDKRQHSGLQHVAFEYETFDDLLGSYTRLKSLGILPMWAADHGVGTAFYYEDPDKNIVELNVNNYGNEWTATEHMRTALPTQAPVDVDRMLAARKAGASPWELHERAMAGEFSSQATNPRARF